MILTKDYAARFQSTPNKQARQNNADLGRRIDKAYKNNDKKYRAALAKLLNSAPSCALAALDCAHHFKRWLDDINLMHRHVIAITNILDQRYACRDVLARG